MKQPLLSCILLVIYFTSSAQHTIPTSGGNATGATGIISYSVGQLTYQSVVSASGRVEQGIEQPAPFFVPLQISFSSLEVKCNKGIMHLSCQSPNTIKPSIMEIEKSTNSTDWDVCHTVSAKDIVANTTMSWVDHAPFKTETYYRLKRIAADGDFTYSNTVLVLNCSTSPTILSVFPNPATDGVMVKLADYEMASFQLTTADGKQLQMGTLTAANHFVSTQQLPIANYYLSIYQNNQLIKTCIISKK